MAYYSDSLGDATKVTILGRDPLANGGSVNPPTHRTSTLIFKDFAEFETYEQGDAISHTGYGRMGTETTHQLEEMISTMEGAHKGWVTASGGSALAAALLSFAKQGAHYLVADSVYSTTRLMCDHELARCGVETTYYDPEITADELEKLIRPNTVLVFLESPGSQTFEVQDVQAIVKVAHKHDVLVVGDNTWGTPLHYKPYALGMDVSIQSVTKYMAGHSDLVMGYVSGTEKTAPMLAKTVKHLGAAPSGDNCFLAMRGIRSMAVRMEAQMKAALDVAGWLQKKAEVSEVLYPALPGAKGHEIYKRDFTGGASLFGLVFKGKSREKIEAFVNALKIFGIGLSWGGYESLVIAYRPERIRNATKDKWDESDYIVRLHIGLEDVADLKADLDGAFAAMDAAV